jgi:hypothetical protein
MDQVALYRHRQIGWTMLLSSLIPLILVFSFTYSGATSPAAVKSLKALLSANPFLALLPVLLLVVIILFSSLEVSVERSVVRLRFGPGGLIRKSWPVESILHAVTTRTTVSQGWGIHRRGGVTLYNVSGFDAVRLTFKDGSAALVGSDDAARLASTINRLVEQR